MYLALSLRYVGIGTAIDNVWTPGLLIPTLTVIHYGAIRRQERDLVHPLRPCRSRCPETYPHLGGMADLPSTTGSMVGSKYW